MIRRINRIAKFRAYRSWVPEANSADFKKINVIFGANGSGKSSLACLLDEASRGGALNSGLELSIRVDESHDRIVGLGQDLFWTRLRVFNRDYVTRSLRFDNDGSSSAAPLLILGERQVDAEKLIKENSEHLAKIDGELLPDLKAKGKGDQPAVDRLLKTTAETIVTELRSVSTKYLQTNTYHSGTVRKLLDSNRRMLANKSTDVAKDLDIARAPSKNPAERPNIVLTTIVDLEQRVGDALAQTVTSQPIPQLLDDRATADWVQQGFDLHEHRDVCAFCTSPISDERRSALARHFDASLKNLQHTLDDLDASREASSLAPSITRSRRARHSWIPWLTTMTRCALRNFWRLRVLRPVATS